MSTRRGIAPAFFLDYNQGEKEVSLWPRKISQCTSAFCSAIDRRPSIWRWTSTAQVSVEDLIQGVNEAGKYQLDLEKLEDIVAQDSKGRYRFNGDHSKIKACQGHSIPWVEPELEYLTPPEFLYHGTTTAAVEKIRKSGAISKMSRHAVHLQADPEKAWQSAVRWHQTPGGAED